MAELFQLPEQSRPLCTFVITPLVFDTWELDHTAATVSGLDLAVAKLRDVKGNTFLKFQYT